MACCNSLMKINIAVFMTIIYHALALFMLCTPSGPASLRVLKAAKCTIRACYIQSESTTVRYPITA